MPLLKAGHFRELRHGMPDGPSLVADRGALDSATSLSAAQYLRGGSVLTASSGCFADHFDPSQAHIGLAVFRTDGVWMWPEDLGYYVEKYRVALPADFLSHMKARDWQAPPLSHEALLAACDELSKEARAARVAMGLPPDG